MDFLNIRIIDIIDIVLVALLLFNVYKLLKGTAAIQIFIGIVILYVVWMLTELLEMELFSKILGGFLGVGMFALIVVFQQEIRRFLLVVGTTNFTSRMKQRYFNLFSKEEGFKSTISPILVDTCKKLSSTNTGALIVIKRNESLEFVKTTGDSMDIAVNQPIIESIFYNNSPLHDGAIIIEGDKISATRVILPLSENRSIPLRFGLRHRAAMGISEETDAVCLVVSEENGHISYFRNGDFVIYDTLTDLKSIVDRDLNFIE
ncbi:MAG TPA: diadenylate cyclase CdaA [Flavobacteriaceae bacterium]|nr:diadenylate cyclase CdaA [Flavobacteriaceae bacterium]